MDRSFCRIKECMVIKYTKKYKKRKISFDCEKNIDNVKKHGIIDL